jgi:hypothetical protein
VQCTKEVSLFSEAARRVRLRVERLFGIAKPCQVHENFLKILINRGLIAP